MENKTKRPLRITETILRDAHQSLIATRMAKEEMYDILPVLDEIGYYSAEVWGGATFDACIRFLDEDPWERLRMIRRRMPKTRLQMLYRGQNMLGYRHYSDDMVAYFVQKSVENGIDILRVFDALNDIRNLETSIKAVKREGAHLQACIAYTISPVHDMDYFVSYAKQLQDTGADSICIKDMAGLISPYMAFNLVNALKANIKIPIHLHTHYVSGMASMACLKAVEAGADGIDTAMSPLALGTSNPPTESMIAAFQDTPFHTGIDLKKLDHVRQHFAQLREKYLANGLLNPKMLGVDANALSYQVPGGMLSNLVSQLKTFNQEEKLEEVLAEVAEVRKDAGYPPLVTPTSQIVGSQAAFNVIAGERYKMVSTEFKSLIQGQYGRTPAPIEEDFRRKIIGDGELIDCRPADLLAPELEKVRSEMPMEYRLQEEDVLTWAMFPQAAPDFFQKRNKDALKQTP